MAGAKPGVHVLQLKRVDVPEVLQKGQRFFKYDDVSIIVDVWFDIKNQGK